MSPNLDQRIAGSCKCGRSAWYACPSADGWDFHICVNHTKADQIRNEHQDHSHQTTICEMCLKPTTTCSCEPFGPAARARAKRPFGTLITPNPPSTQQG